MDKVTAMALDDVDVELVDALRRDGRASFESLADTIGLSRRATRTRVQRILDDGVVRVVATVRPEFDGIHAIAHLSVGVSSTDRDEVARAITELDESVFVSIVSGQSAVVAEVRTATLTRLADVVDQVRGIAGVRDVDTVVYTDVLKEPHLPPPSALPGVGDSERAIDDLDRALVARLRTDGRASYADLAQQVGLSAAATRARVRRLIDLDQIRVVALVDPTRLGRAYMTGVALTFDRAAGTVLDRIAAIDAVDFLARTLGACDAMATIVTPGPDETVAVLDRLGAVDGVQLIRSWTHLRLVKERYDHTPPVTEE